MIMFTECGEVVAGGDTQKLITMYVSRKEKSQEEANFKAAESQREITIPWRA